MVHPPRSPWQNRTDLIELYSNESTKTLETLNLTMSAAREAGQLYNCDKYAYMPLVYLLLVPVWQRVERGPLPWLRTAPHAPAW